MTLYAVDARRINDRPDSRGWYSSGIDLPTFYVDAPDPTDALLAAHRIAGDGRTDITRTLVWLIAYDPDSSDRYGDVHHSIHTWNGWPPTDHRGVSIVHTVDTWTPDGGLTARVVVDEHAESPRDWHNVATLVQLSDRHTQPDEPNTLSDALLRAWRHFGDLDRLERYARAYLGAVAIDTRDAPTSDSRVRGVITHIDVAREQLADPSATLRAELDTYRAWAEGRVYGVIVTAPDGRHSSLWGCYDNEFGFPYLHDVADDLATEVTPSPSPPRRRAARAAGDAQRRRPLQHHQRTKSTHRSNRHVRSDPR